MTSYRERLIAGVHTDPANVVAEPEPEPAAPAKPARTAKTSPVAEASEEETDE